MRFKFPAYIFLTAILFGCNTSEPEKNNGKEDLLQGLKKDESIRYAKRFSIAKNENCTVLYLFGNLNLSDTSAIFAFPNSAVAKFPSRVTVIPQSCKRIASLSSVYTTMLCELGAGDKIAAIDNIDYYTNPSIQKKFAENTLAELSKGPQPDIEKALSLQPDAILTFGMAEAGKGWEEKIKLAGIPLLITLDHLEETPLARAEWIKCISLFVNKRKKADSIFNAIEKNYNELKRLASEAKEHPKVFSEIKYGEIWYVPGGKSFAATLMKDAGADYIWKADEHSGSLQLSFEEVLRQAGSADFWLNQSLVKSKEELRSLEPRYTEFKAFKTGNLYNNIKNTNEKGYSDYWETGILYPNRILSDLVQIFHPELKAQVKNDLYYYKKLE
jgi:iron complex transport system substrate-binding protein